MMPKQLTRTLLSGASLAAALAVLSPAAYAQGLTNANTIYAAQGIPASGAVTIPSGAPATVLAFTSCPFTAPVAGGTALVTISLPGSVTFASVPTATAGGAFTAGPAAIVGGGVGSSQVVYSVTYPTFAAPNVGTILLGPFQITGATSLAFSSTAGIPGPIVAPPFPGETQITYSAFVSAATNDVPAASAVPQCSAAGPVLALGQIATFNGILATSANAVLQAGTPIAGGGPVINVGAPGNAQKFNEKVLNETNGVAADMGFLTFTVIGLSNSIASGTFVPSSTSGTITETGNFQGIASGLLLNALGAGAPGSCPATNTGGPAGSISATPVANTLTFTGVTIPATGPVPAYTPGLPPAAVIDNRESCVYASGTQLIAPSNAPIPVVPSAGAVPAAISYGIGTTLGTASAFGAAVISGYTYNGTVAQVLYSQQNVVNPGFVRADNPNLIPAVCSAAIQGDQGGAGSFAVTPFALASIPAQSNDTEAVGTLVTNAGITPGPFGRVSIVILCAQTNIGLSHMEYSPGTNALSYIP